MSGFSWISERARGTTYAWENTRPQPAPAQVRHGLVPLRLPLPPHSGHGPDGWDIEIEPFPPQTRHDTM
jgi:hypothetical protein